VQMPPEMEPELLASWLAEPRMLAALEPGEAQRIALEGEIVLPRLREPALTGLASLRAEMLDRG